MSTCPYIRKVHFYETDQMGVVHHSNYIRWFEESRAHYMEQIGFSYSKVVASGIDLAVLGVLCEYKSMTRFSETVKVYVSIASFGLSNIILSYRVHDSETGELRATGQSKHCYYNNQKKRPVSLKKELPEVYELFLAKAADNTENNK